MASKARDAFRRTWEFQEGTDAVIQYRCGRIAAAMAGALLVATEAAHCQDQHLIAQELAAAQEKAVTAVHSFIVAGQCDSEIIIDEKPPLHAATLKFICTWQGGETKLEKQTVQPAAENDPPAIRISGVRRWHFDSYNGKNGYLELADRGGRDLGQPPPTVSENNPGTLSGTLNATQPDDLATGYLFNQCLFRLGYFLKTWSLPELVQQYSTQILEQPSEKNNHCYVLSAALPEEKIRFNVHIDPRHNYLVRKVVCFGANDKPKYNSEVLSFADCGDAIWFPERIQGDGYQDNGVHTVSRLAFQVRQINQEIPESAFALDIPEWTPVTDFRSKTVQLWGKNGPHKTYTQAEYGVLRLQATVAWYRMLGAAVVAVILALAAVLFVRHRRKKAAVRRQDIAAA